jgi:hypothetical protein
MSMNYFLTLSGTKSLVEHRIKLDVRFLRKVSRAAHLTCLVLRSREVSVLRGVRNTVNEAFEVIISFNRVRLLLMSQLLNS